MNKWILFFLTTVTSLSADPQLLILGIAQDGGYPHAGCGKSCCERAWKDPSQRRLATSLVVYDNDTFERWLFDASPDLKEQLHLLNEISPCLGREFFTGIFLTHAHVGHYIGLYHFGREGLATRGMKVYAMEKMCEFLSCNGPWDQLVNLQNIELVQLQNKKRVLLTEGVAVEPLLVPHRAEYTETVGYKIYGPHKTVLFIPDIDSWEEMEEEINEWISSVDLAFLDATFFNGHELPGRDLSKIPHPFVEDSMKHFSSLSKEDKNKIHFIHLNHSNPLLWDQRLVEFVEKQGYHVAIEREVIRL